MKMMRKFPRYRVQDLTTLEVDVDRIHSLQHLVILGEGGCGFYGTIRDQELESRMREGRMSRVYCKFSWEGMADRPLQVQANVLYCFPKRIGNRLVYFYGLEFIKPHRDRIEPIIRKLEVLALEGKVKVD